MKGKNRSKWILGAVAGLGLVVLVAAGAFTAVRLLRADPADDGIPAGAMVFEDVMDDGNGSPVTVTTIVVPSPLLPDEPAAAGGILLRQEDNSLYVGTGNIELSVDVVNGESRTSANHDGPEVEVVVGRNTRYYRDVTKFDEDMSESGERRLTQELAEVENPETFDQSTSIQAWGSRNGDRVIADIIVYGNP